MNSTTLTPGEAAAVGAAVGGVFGAFAIFVIVFYVLTVIATWKIFAKAGEPGWKALIPVYNFYIMYKIVDMQNWFWITLVAAVVTSIVLTVTGAPSSTATVAQAQAYNWGANPVAIIFVVIDAIVSIIAFFMNNWRISKVFGHGAGYFVGLIFFPNIFWLILGFGKSKYNKKHLKA